MAKGRTSAGLGRFGGSSVRSSSFFFDGSIYSHTSLVLAVSYTIKNYWVQLDGWLRIRLTFNSLVVVIFRILIGQAGSKSGSNWRLGRTLF